MILANALGASRERVGTRTGKDLLAPANPVKPSLGHFTGSPEQMVGRSQTTRVAAVELFELDEPDLGIHALTRKHVLFCTYRACHVLIDGPCCPR